MALLQQKATDSLPDWQRSVIFHPSSAFGGCPCTGLQQAWFKDPANLPASDFHVPEKRRSGQGGREDFSPFRGAQVLGDPARPQPTRSAMGRTTISRIRKDVASWLTFTPALVRLMRAWPVPLADSLNARSAREGTANGPALYFFFYSPFPLAMPDTNSQGRVCHLREWTDEAIYRTKGHGKPIGSPV
jgi:hypothetical protein